VSKYDDGELSPDELCAPAQRVVAVMGEESLYPTWLRRRHEQAHGTASRNGPRNTPSACRSDRPDVVEC
jgi:hypothetical protein